MRYAMLGFAVATATWVLTPAPGARHAPRSGATQQDHWSWHGRLAQGKTLEIRGINGDVSAQAASGDEIEVTAEKHARRSDPDDVRIQVVEHEDGVTICAVYPSSRGRENTCEPGGGHSNIRDNDVRVDFTVHVPRGVHFDGNTVNGSVEATGLTGDVSLNTVNGQVQLETNGGDASAGTVNGSIEATVNALGSRPLHFSTVNGQVSVALPGSLSADLDAKTVNGSITSDFPISVQGRLSPRHLMGRIGDGGRALELETVNGSIRLRRLP